MNTNTLSGHSNNSQRRWHSLAFVFLTLWASLFSFAGAAYPAPEIAINSILVNEAAGSATFTVTLSEPGDTAIKVDYAAVGNTASGDRTLVWLLARSTGLQGTTPLSLLL